MSKGCLVIVVVEDESQEMLVRRFLRNKGLGTHEMRIERSPSGVGSAENWVRQKFVREVTVYRRRHARTAVIVAIDADTNTVQHRQRQLNDALEAAGESEVDAKSEEIARLVPRRNVESWILCLNGHAVDEETDYKNTKNNWTELIPSAAKTLLLWTHSKDAIPQHCIDSVKDGIGEIKRLRVFDHQSH
jgi:hypothetical protein